MMNRAGIAKAVIMPPPQSPNQAGAYTYDELLAAIRRYPDRLILAAGGGELNPMIIGTDSAAVTEEIRAEFQKQADRIVRDGARAFGEMSALHFSFSERHTFKQAPPDHPLFRLLADIAARHGIPIDLHIEAAEADETVPVRLTSRSRANPAAVAATIPGLERLLSHNRGANIVWQHGGWDNTGHATPELFHRLFARHPNFYCALKVVRRQYEPFRSANSLCDDNLRLHPDWRELIIAYPDRFVIGADEFVLAAGSTQRKGPPSFEDTWSIIDQLPEEVRERVGRTNAARIYGLE
jgi:predicted TIM-barrel fold metal-dependent hydrolase